MCYLIALCNKARNWLFTKLNHLNSFEALLINNLQKKPPQLFYKEVKNHIHKKENAKADGFHVNTTMSQDGPSPFAQRYSVKFLRNDSLENTDIAEPLF